MTRRKRPKPVLKIFGDVARFAIQYRLNDDSGGLWMYGKICFWIHGTMVGKYDLGDSLRDALFVMERFESDAGARGNPRFASMPGADAFCMLQTAMYGDKPGEVPSEIVNEEQWARQEVGPAIDVFRRVKLFLIAGHGVERLLLGDRGDFVSEHILEIGELDRILRAAVDELGADFMRAGGPPR